MTSFYNSLSLTKEPFKPNKAGHVKLYACGPTPYNYAHVGNLRTYVFGDILTRTLRFLGYTVDSMMNITDIDDKTLRDSVKAGKSLKEFTAFYTEAFLADMDALGIIRPDHIVPISGEIGAMVEIINGLLKKGIAYVAEDGIYYRIAGFKDYGKLAHLDMSGMKSSVRINNDEYDKESLADFALWKAYNPTTDGENQWEAEFVVDGQSVNMPGRPGWHIECSACNHAHFGAQIDIHIGGIDLLFPHHQNEVAQTEAFTGKAPFAKYWMHAGHLLVDGRKMSKSLGNFLTLRDVIEHFGQEKAQMVGRAFRLSMLQAHYRENTNLTWDRLEAAINTLDGYDALTRRLVRTSEAGTEKPMRRELSNTMQEWMQEYVACLEDDLALPEAMAVVSESVRRLNAELDAGSLSTKEAIAALDWLKTLNAVLGVFSAELLSGKTQEVSAIPEAVQTLLAARNAAKAAKNFAEADTLRTQIEAAGWRVVDDRNGAYLEKIPS